MSSREVLIVVTHVDSLPSDLHSLKAAESLPSGYVHKSISEQINEQRAIYNHLYEAFLAYQKNPQHAAVPSTIHLPGLFPILKNAVALVHDHINTLGLSPQVQEPILRALNDVYQSITQSNAEHKTTYQFFLKMNGELAFIDDWAKQVSKNSEYISNPTGMLLKHSVIYEKLDYIKKRIFEKMPPNPTDLNLQGAPLKIYSKKLFSPAIIIYGDYKKQTKIPIKPFVDQAFATPYTTGIALFDPLNAEYPITPKTKINPVSNEPHTIWKKGSKKDAHYSSFNGTLNMLVHDLAHIREKAKTFKQISQKKINWEAGLKKINDLRVSLSKNEATKNEAAILENGLFILTHEILNVTLNSGGKNRNSIPKHISSLMGLVNMISENMQQTVQSMMLGYNDFEKDQGGIGQQYKEYFRDHEFILTRLNVYDKQGNKFVDFNQIKNSNVSQTEKLQLREKAVIDGYHRFWMTFIGILDEYIKDPDSRDLIFGSKQQASPLSHNEQQPNPPSGNKQSHKLPSDLRRSFGLDSDSEDELPLNSPTGKISSDLRRSFGINSDPEDEQHLNPHPENEQPSNSRSNLNISWG